MLDKIRDDNIKRELDNEPISNKIAEYWQNRTEHMSGIGDYG